MLTAPATCPTRYTGSAELTTLELAAAYRDPGGWGRPTTTDPFTLFLRGYVDAMLSLATDDDGTPWDDLPDAPGVYDLAPETQRTLAAEARAFFDARGGWVAHAMDHLVRHRGGDWIQHGHDLAMVAEGTGCGFRDRLTGHGRGIAGRLEAIAPDHTGRGGLYAADNGLAYLA